MSYVVCRNLNVGQINLWRNVVINFRWVEGRWSWQQRDLPSVLVRHQPRWTRMEHIVLKSHQGSIPFRLVMLHYGYNMSQHDCGVAKQSIDLHVHWIWINAVLICSSVPKSLWLQVLRQLLVLFSNQKRGKSLLLMPQSRMLYSHSSEQLSVEQSNVLVSLQDS